MSVKVNTTRNINYGEGQWKCYFREWSGRSLVTFKQRPEEVRESAEGHLREAEQGSVLGRKPSICKALQGMFGQQVGGLAAVE